MFKSVFTFGFLISSLVMLAVTPFLNQQDSFSNTAMAHGYDNYGDSKYSKYPTEENKYECQKGPFERFFESSVEFCKKTVSIIDNGAGTPGSQGPPGPAGADSTVRGPEV